MKLINKWVSLPLILLVSAMLTGVVAQNKNIQVTGTVIEKSTQEPIIGATAQVVNTTVGSVTDLDGRFSLSAPLGAKIKVTFIGFTPYEFTVTESSQNIRIELSEDTQLLDEVVVIGYGSARKQDLSTSVSSINLGEASKSGPSSLSSMLQGRLPGVTIQNDGGDPLAGSALNIRGKGSRGGDEVLYVVDGVPGAPFNIEDVENITVLKDAASAAIYGASVGSGGVIVVTTKKAQQGAVKVDFNISNSIKNASNLPKVTNAEEYQRVWAKAAETDGFALPAVADASIFPYGTTTRTNWLDEIFRTGLLQHYAVTLSGGTEKVKALASFSMDHDKGILLNTFRKDLSGRVNVDFNINKWLNFNQNLTVTYSNGQGNVNTTSHEGVIMGAVFYPTSATVYEYDSNGNQLFTENGKPRFGGTIPEYLTGSISGYGEIRNPVATLSRLRQYRPSSTIFSTSALTIMPITGLNIKTALSLGLNQSRYENFEAKVPEYGLKRDVNERYISNSLNRNWLWENTATYSTLLKDKHHFSLMGGFTMSYNNFRFNDNLAKGFVNEDFYLTIFPNATSYNFPPGEAIVEESMVSMFGRVSYSYADRYFLTSSLRNDMSSKLYKGNRSGIFPAFSGSWKISSEQFMEDYKDVINLLKLRGSWGQVGNVKIVPNYSYNVSMATARESVYGNPPVLVTGKYQSTISNPNIKWETTESWGIGLDLGLLNSLTLSVDYYNKTTKDLIEKLPITSTMGVEEEPYGNVGKVLNKGWEFTLNYDKKFGDWRINAFGNLSTLKSEVLDLGTRDFIVDDWVIDGMLPVRSAVGQPWQSFYLIQTDGLFRSQAEIDAYTYTNPETGESTLIQPYAKPGDLKFVDLNNDGVINDDDKTYMGSYLPTLTYSFGGQMGYKGLDLSVMFQGIHGNKIFNGFKKMGLVGRQSGNNMLASVLDSYNFNPNSDIPRLSIKEDVNGNFGTASDFFLEDGSYLRLKNVTLGYRLSKETMSKLHLPNSSIRLYMSGENLLTFTKYSGIDPEVGGIGIDGGRYPISRTFTFGINLNF